MAADLAEDSTEGAAVSTAVASGGITEAGVELAGMGVGAVMAGTEAGVGMAGAAGDTRAGELPSALAGAGVGVPIGQATRMRMAIPTTLTPIIRITHTMGRTRMRRPTRIGITVATEIRVTTRSSKILAMPGGRDYLA